MILAVEKLEQLLGVYLASFRDIMELVKLVPGSDQILNQNKNQNNNEISRL